MSPHHLDHVELVAALHPPTAGQFADTTGLVTDVITLANGT